MTLIKISDIVVNGYYQNLENGEIVKVNRYKDGEIEFYNDDIKNTKKQSYFLQMYEYKPEINDFPNAKDPKLPYVFDLNYDIKYTSDLIRTLKYDKYEEHGLMELIKDFKVYENNNEVKKIYDKYNSNIKNHIKKIKSISFYEIDKNNIKFTLKVEEVPKKESVVIELKKEENGVIEYLNKKAKFTEDQVEIKADYNKILNFIQKIINKKENRNESNRKNNTNI